MKRKLYLVVLLFAVLFMIGCEKTSKSIEQDKEQSNKEQAIDLKEEAKVETAAIKEVKKTATKVILETNQGNIVIEMMDKNAPMTVKNFVQYVNDRFYDGVIFHRVIPGFMIQTGGFTEMMEQKQTRKPVINEFDLSNVRGTVAMAKVGGDPDSATSQFFVNLADNSRNLDNQNGGFTVFGKVVQGMDVVDKIAAIATTVRMGMPDVPVEPIVIKAAKVVSDN